MRPDLDALTDAMYDRLADVVIEMARAGEQGNHVAADWLGEAVARTIGRLVDHRREIRDRVMDKDPGVLEGGAA